MVSSGRHPAPRSGRPGPDSAPAALLLAGGGAAGLAVLHQLACRWRGPALRVVVVDPRDLIGDPVADRTWCFWARADDPDWAWSAQVETASWGRVRLGRHDGSFHVADLGPYRYRMIASQDYARFVGERVRDAVVKGHLVVEHVAAEVGEVTQDAALARVRLRAGSGVVGAEPPTPEPGVEPMMLEAAFVLDSRPPSSTDVRERARTVLLQHFAGEVVRFGDARFAGSVAGDEAVLMDFGVRQPDSGVAFGYVLPIDAHTALVEYTEFSRHVLDDEGYRTRLDTYRGAAGLGGSAEVLHRERGVIPMTDAPLSPGPGPRVFRIGTAGGATRASTGYTFAGIQSQARSVVDALLAGRPPRPISPYPARHAWLDSVMLRALDDGSLSGDFFPDLFAANPAARVLRFLDGSAGPRDDLAVIASSPTVAMLRGLVSRARGPRGAGGGRPAPGSRSEVDL